VGFIWVMDMNLKIVNNRVNIGSAAKIAFYITGIVDAL